MEFLKVWTSFREVISPLNDAEKGRLFDAMLLYAETGEEPQEFKGNERFLWLAARQDIDRTALRNETLRQNGLKGGRPKSKENQTEPNESKENQSEPNKSCNIKKSNIKKDNVNNTPSEYRRFTPPTEDEVRAYCKERGNSVNSQKFIDFYSSKGWKVGNQPMKDWKACVRTWEQRDSNSNVRQIPVNPAQAYSQRTYSEPGETLEELMKRVEGV